jgi:uncharacterized protein (TIGR03492 family)
MPSGGFIYMDGRELWRDLQGGLFKLTIEQYKTVRKWAESGGTILAVGDIVPLFFAWLSGANYAFVGTAKSEYYLRDEDGWLLKTSTWARAMQSVYLPHERYLMASSKCKAIFPRDSLTAKILQKWSIVVSDLGNPMMDGLIPQYLVEDLVKSPERQVLYILLLPGSRMPEAQRNWEKILEAVVDISSYFKNKSFIFLAAIAPGIPEEIFSETLKQISWFEVPINSVLSPVADPEARAFRRDNNTLIITQNAYADCALAGDFAIAMAGTATEQFVGLGKPVISIPGKGPQFTYAFAEAQTRLLGPSVILAKKTTLVAPALESLLTDADAIEIINENGKRRMGSAGAAKRIARAIMEKLFALKAI